MTVQDVAVLAAVALAILLPFIAAGWELGDRFADWRRERRLKRASGPPRADPRKIYELEKAVGFIDGTPEEFQEAYGYPRRRSEV